MLKLALFFGMLGLAAFNRWQLVPSIRAMLGGGGQVTAVFRLWRAIMAETTLGFRLLAVVAILRTLSPGDCLSAESICQQRQPLQSTDDI